MSKSKSISRTLSIIQMQIMSVMAAKTISDIMNEVFRGVKPLPTIELKQLLKNAGDFAIKMMKVPITTPTPLDQHQLNDLKEFIHSEIDSEIKIRKVVLYKLLADDSYLSSVYAAWSSVKELSVLLQYYDEKIDADGFMFIIITIDKLFNKFNKFSHRIEEIEGGGKMLLLTFLTGIWLLFLSPIPSNTEKFKPFIQEVLRSELDKLALQNRFETHPSLRGTVVKYPKTGKEIRALEGNRAVGIAARGIHFVSTVGTIPEVKALAEFAIAMTKRAGFEKDPNSYAAYVPSVLSAFTMDLREVDTFVTNLYYSGVTTPDVFRTSLAMQHAFRHMIPLMSSVKHTMSKVKYYDRKLSTLVLSLEYIHPSLKRSEFHFELPDIKTMLGLSMESAYEMNEGGKRKTRRLKRGKK